MTVNLAHLDEPRIANHRGFVVLMGGAYKKYLSPQTARELAQELINNADRAERTTGTPAWAGNIAKQKRNKR